ncbi:replication initiation protein [Aliivibrio sp. S3MY1]|uniref:replication initiation protein n=1 Tax=unclassified Aliivibrio TaxID=2645654 RepID=UPI002379B535|nr:MULTISPECIES: replication initiation protein [unclassified Aliivibrio]MDD9197454.1 replication initiation protein [Aliivibrio sp. S3MY1]MDD9200699.1 replication initiation protein [Aliivibrio sp. S2MY1]
MKNRLPLTTLNTWHPLESLSSEFEVIPFRDRKKKHIPTLNRKLFNTLEKYGAWVNSQWPFLVHKLVEVGMRKRNLSFKEVHKCNIENTLRWISYHSDAVTGCINVTHLCIEIGKEIGVSSSTISVIMKELVIMGLLYEPEHSGQSIQDILHDGRLPRTLCTTPLFYEMFGINQNELDRLRSIEIKRREIEYAKRQEKYDAEIALKTYCHSNILRVWEYRHTQSTSSYKIKLADMAPMTRLAYISRKLLERIKAKEWSISTEKDNITKMANNLLRRMGLSVKKSEFAPPIP